jgi:hypothetical protein
MSLPIVASPPCPFPSYRPFPSRPPGKLPEMPIVHFPPPPMTLSPAHPTAKANCPAALGCLRLVFWVGPPLLMSAFFKGGIFKGGGSATIKIFFVILIPFLMAILHHRLLILLLLIFLLLLLLLHRHLLLFFFFFFFCY